jgi:Amt family ammonium transporter
LWNAGFFLKELAAVVMSSIYAFVISYLMLRLVNKITPVKVTNQDEENGLNTILHGESAYEMIWFLLSSESNITPG